MSDDTPLSGDLADYSFARDLGERIIRQVLQVIGPVLALVASTGEGFDYKAAGLAVALAVILTVLKAVFNVTAPEGAPTWRVLLDRAGSAAAGVLLGFIPVSAMDLLTVEWDKAAIAAGAGALLAVASYYGAPPALARGGYRLAA